jgi:hypothetical protein
MSLEGGEVAVMPKTVFKRNAATRAAFSGYCVKTYRRDSMQEASLYMIRPHLKTDRQTLMASEYVHDSPLMVMEAR